MNLKPTSATPHAMNLRLFIQIGAVGFLLAIALLFALRAAGVSRSMASAASQIVLWSGFILGQWRAVGIPLNRRFVTFAIPVVLGIAFVNRALMTMTG